MNFITNGDQNVVLGSGNLYAVKVSEISDVFSLTTAEEAKLKYLGYIEANAALKVSSEKKELISANGGKVGNFYDKKNVSFSTGIFSWDLKNVSDFLTGSSIETDVATGKQTFTYAHEDTPPVVYLRFVSEDLTANKRITINMFACQFTGELNFEFSNDKPVTFDYSFDLLTNKSATNKHVYYKLIAEDIAEE